MVAVTGGSCYPSRGGKSTSGVGQKHGKMGQRIVERDQINLTTVIYFLML